MNWKYKIFFSLVFLCCFNGIYAQPIQKLRIDPAQAYGGSVSEYFSAVEYIPLETTKESLFGSATQLIITDSSYIIYDYDTKSILFFSKDGKFLKKKKFNNQSIQVFMKWDQNKNYLTASNQQYDVDKDEKLYFSHKGDVLSNPIKSVSNIKRITLTDDYSYEISGCAMRSGEVPKDTTIYLITLYKKDSLIGKFLPYNPSKDIAFCTLAGYINSPKYFNSDTLYFSIPIEQTIYRITKNNVEPVYKILFPNSRSIPESILNSKNKKEIEAEKKNIIANDKLILSINNIDFINNNFYFKITPYHYIYNEGSEEENQYNFIYNLSSTKLVSLERITSDRMSSYLPLFGSTLKTTGIEMEKHNMYSCIASLNMFAAYEKNKNRNPQYPLVLQQYFKTQNRKSNPVIVRMKLKE